MADAFYTKFKEGTLNGAFQVDFDTDTIKAGLFRSSAYTVNLATDDFLDDAGSPIAEATLTPTVSGANVDAADFSFSSVGAGAEIDLLVIYKDTGTPATSPLVAKYDISVTPNGNDINVTVNGSGLFDL